MNDQAQELRKLMLATARDPVDRADSAPCVIAITGSKGGVGTTTLCVNLAAAMAQQGHRVVLLDADVQCGDVGTLCGIVESYTLADVFQTRITLEDALQPGPAGMLVLPGCWAPESTLQPPPHSYQRLMAATSQLGHLTDWVIVDAGAGDPRQLQILWQLADRVLVTVTPDAVSVLNGYARMKWLVRSRWRQTCHTLVNQTANQRHATEIHQRLAQSCHRFLGITPTLAGWVPLDAALTTPSDPVPLICQTPNAPAALAVGRIGMELARSTPVASHLTSPRSAPTHPEDQVPSSLKSLPDLDAIEMRRLSGERKCEERQSNSYTETQ